MNREEGLKRESELIAANRKIESDLRARVVMPEVREPSPEPRVEIFHVGPVEEPKPDKKGAMITMRKPPVYQQILSRSITLKDAAVRGSFAEFKALGGTFDEFKTIRDRMAR